jgi:hypothetical protein
VEVMGGVGVLTDYKQGFEGRGGGVVSIQWVSRGHYGGWGLEEV